jgi:hypothetical protein
MCLNNKNTIFSGITANDEGIRCFKVRLEREQDYFQKRGPGLFNPLTCHQVSRQK